MQIQSPGSPAPLSREPSGLGSGSKKTFPRSHLLSPPSGSEGRIGMKRQSSISRGLLSRTPSGLGSGSKQSNSRPRLLSHQDSVDDKEDIFAATVAKVNQAKREIAEAEAARKRKEENKMTFTQQLNWLSNKVAITIGGASKAEDDHVIEEGSNEGDDYSETNSIPTTLASSEMEQLHIADKRTHFELRVLKAYPRNNRHKYWEERAKRLASAPLPPFASSGTDIKDGGSTASDASSDPFEREQRKIQSLLETDYGINDDEEINPSSYVMKFYKEHQVHHGHHHPYSGHMHVAHKHHSKDAREQHALIVKPSERHRIKEYHGLLRHQRAENVHFRLPRLPVPRPNAYPPGFRLRDMQQIVNQNQSLHGSSQGSRGPNLAECFEELPSNDNSVSGCNDLMSVSSLGSVGSDSSPTGKRPKGAILLSPHRRPVGTPKTRERVLPVFVPALDASSGSPAILNSVDPHDTMSLGVPASNQNHKPGVAISNDEIMSLLKPDNPVDVARQIREEHIASREGGSRDHIASIEGEANALNKVNVHHDEHSHMHHLDKAELYYYEKHLDLAPPEVKKAILEHQNKVSVPASPSKVIAPSPSEIVHQAGTGHVHHHPMPWSRHHAKDGGHKKHLEPTENGEAQNEDTDEFNDDFVLSVPGSVSGWKSPLQSYNGSGGATPPLTGTGADTGWKSPLQSYSGSGGATPPLTGTGADTGWKSPLQSYSGSDAGTVHTVKSKSTVRETMVNRMTSLSHDSHDPYRRQHIKYKLDSGPKLQGIGSVSQDPADGVGADGIDSSVSHEHHLREHKSGERKSNPNSRESNRNDADCGGAGKLDGELENGVMSMLSKAVQVLPFKGYGDSEEHKQASHADNENNRHHRHKPTAKETVERAHRERLLKKKQELQKKHELEDHKHDVIEERHAKIEVAAMLVDDSLNPLDKYYLEQHKNDETLDVEDVLHHTHIHHHIVHKKTGLEDLHMDKEFETAQIEAERKRKIEMKATHVYDRRDVYIDDSEVFG